ncbi:hypothetical protein Sango_2898900 [Sesamum angolense]|uniref:Retrovirus-related Pol polyprotein from transposon TNT 1-94-like beta-barrel domain-containing protein n=1 Tax=Sesamum angolense TaxID=2727404 RepID=A0AAE1T646_9LAMI|nr:hypothetical protein Sango_2898900 [Sesamum angolense]
MTSKNFAGIGPRVSTDENYHIQTIKTKAYLRAKSLWHVVEYDFRPSALRANPTLAQIKKHEKGHMPKDERMFSSLNKFAKIKVKLGNDRSVQAEGKGSICVYTKQALRKIFVKGFTRDLLEIAIEDDSPGQVDMGAAKHILRYAKGTYDYGIW